MAEKSNIDGVTITARGLQLITKLVAAESQMEFSSVKVGTGILAAGMNPYELTNLVQYKMDGMIAGYGYDEEAMDAYVVMQLSNNQVETGFVMTEVGLYAMDPDLGEILYGYLDLSNDPNYIMPAENGRSKTVQIKLHIIVGEVNEIKASINPLSQVTREELEKELEKRVSIQGGDISDTIINPENPPEIEGEAVKYPEIEESGTTKGILGKIQRWVESLKDDKVDKMGGDTSETAVSVINESTDAFPVPMSGDKTKTLWGKLKKWQQDCLAKFGERLPGETIPAESWNELTYTIEHESIKKGSTVYIGYTFESIPAAQKANIRGKTEQGKLILVAAKAPPTDIEIEEIRVLNLNE